MKSSTGAPRRARRTLRSLSAEELAGRRVLVRVDYNVPLEGRGAGIRVSSDTRIRASLPTLHHLLGGRAIVVLASHLGRPKGRRVPELSLEPIGRCLEDLLGRKVSLLAEPFGGHGARPIDGAQEGDVYLLENLRFDPGETANDPELSRRLAGFGEVFVQDAFGTCHRRHASTVGVTEHLHPCVAGLLVERELAAFDRLLDPEPPFVAILGGAKIAGKIKTVHGLAARCECVCLGGGMANTFLLAAGHDVGDSLVEEELVGEARSLLDARGETLVLPSDAVVARGLDPEDERRTVPIDRVENGWKILDVGPETVHRFSVELEHARTIFWNGPLGVFETPPFDAATRAIACRLAESTERGAYTVTGGGDSIAALEAAGMSAAVSHVSTGGGAALELVSGAALPGIEALDPAPRDQAP